MRTLVSIGLATFISSLALAQTAAPAAASRYVSVIGTVQTADTAGHVFTVKTDKSGDTTVKFDDKTSFRRIPAGETDIKKATPAKASDVGAGDRILARVRTENPTGIPALTFYITKQAEIAQRNQKTLEEWQTQSVSGKVKAVDDPAKKITMTVQSAPSAPAKEVTVDVGGAVNFERRGPESFNYEPDKLASIQPGDNIRVLGEKNADQTQIKAEAVQSDAFKQFSVQIKSVDAAAGEISATDIASKRPITIYFKPNSTMKKLDDATAAMMARRFNPTAQGGGRGRGGNAGGRGFAGPGGGGRGPAGGGRGMDLNKLLEQQPSIQLSDLKAGEPVVILAAASGEGSKLTAMTLVAGVEPILRAAPQNGPDPLGGNWNLGDGGGGGDQ